MAKKILLADDSLTIQKVVELTFSDSEYELACVSNGQRALDRIAGGEIPDLILADVVMPEKNGYEVCEAIKANPATARIPVVLLSGTFEPFDRDRADRLGCDAIVSKPFDSQQLLRQVEALLARPVGEIPTTATMAIPVMTISATPPAPSATSATPAPAAASAPSAESGFSPEDFTGSIRTPAQVAGGPDLFEEEYGQVDVESAIAAFEKAHPEFEYGEATGERPASMAGDVDSAPEESQPAGTAAAGPHEEREAAAPPMPPAPAPFWVPRAPEPELAPIPFGADDSGVRPPAEPAPSDPVATMRADEAPTQQIPLAAEFAALGRLTDAPAERQTDPSVPRVSEEAAELANSETHALFAPAEAPEAFSPLDAPSAVSSEIEVLAQNTSIGQLKEMLSSVSRPESGMSDDEIDRLASRVVERLSERIVREIAWEVIPDMAEIVIKQRIRELESGVE